MRRLLSVVAYAAAGIVILLAILLGMFRLFLPRLPEYQEDIKGWANAAIGLEVEFTDMNARWRLTGPELNFFSAELSLPDTNEPFIRAGEVTVGVGLLRLLVDRTLVVDRVLVSDTTLSFERTNENQLLVQGLPTDELAAFLPQSSAAGDVVFVGEDIEVHYRDPSAEATLGFDVALVEATRRDQRLSVEASLDLDEGFGSRLDIALDQRGAAADDDIVWDLFLEGRSLGLARWATLLPPGVAPATAGTGDLSLWLQWSGGGVAKATANLLVEGMTVAEADRGAPVEIEGRVEYSRFGNGILLSADNFRLRTVDGDWPRSSFQLRLDRDDANAELRAVEAQASYLKVTDLGYFSAWWPAQARELLARYRPTGAVRELKIDLADLGTDDVSYDVSGLLEDAGIGAADALPGVRNFTGSVRANDSGGRIDSISKNLLVQLPRYVSETIGFDDANGTLIWRRSGDSLTVLSDRLELRNADLDSQSSVQVTIAGEGEPPIVDLESTWRVADIAAAKRFLPQPVISPPLYRWLNSALVAGRLVDGRTRLQGPLDKFPFDGGEGEFRIAATLENAVMRYADSWPAARIRTMDVVLDGMRLYTERNSAVSAGNVTEDARVEIADLRDPVLTIDAFSTGSLETIRQFVLRSPIVTLFGDQLERTSVGGDASFNLLLSYPIKVREDYDFSTRIQVSGGTLALDGFAPPLSELYGIVSISREELTSESLFGRFLDEPVTLALSRDVTAEGGYNVVADVAGQASVTGLVSGLNAPLSDVMTGSGNYTAHVRFPQAGATDSLPLKIDINSDLQGFALNLPAPLSKPADDTLPLELTIEFPESGVITSSAVMGDAVGWVGEFRRAQERWDFDRGMLSLGGATAERATLRGLHVVGHVEELRVDEWLSQTAGEAGAVRVGDRIRAINLSVDDLRAYGQHYSDHRLTVDRGGNRWFVHAEGDKLNGDITIPYDFSGQEPVTVDMQTMVLPGPATDESPALPTSPDGLDPRRMPPVSVKVAEFGIGERRLGAIDAEFIRVPEGLRAESVIARDESFEIAGSAGWVVEDGVSGVPHSYVKAKLESNDVEKTMDRLSYDAGIEAGDMQLDVDVRWPGAPRRDFLNDLEGSLSVRLGSGQLNEIEPGAGRVFGLMSVVALPRRLSLDFRDVFDKGFGFDEIRGTFEIDRGEASTCDLSLSGPAAEIVIIGSADIANSEYNQTALVSANVGNTLPLVATVVAGPQVGAALLIFSQIFKKPLQEVGQAYYGIDGSFEEPLVERVDGTRFENASRQAGCLPEGTADN